MIAVVFSFDVLPAIALGCFGGRFETPHFDHLAARAVVFDQHFAASPLPEDAFQAWWQQRYPWAVAENETLLAASLNARGVQTVAIFETGTRLAPHQAGFGEVKSVASPHELLQWLDEEGPQVARNPAGCLVWLHGRGLKSPVDFQRELTEETAETEIAGLDAFLGDMLKEVARVFNGQAHLVVTAAVGRGVVAHPGLTESSLHVPLFIMTPQTDCMRQLALTQNVDLGGLIGGWFPGRATGSGVMAGLDDWNPLLCDQQQTGRAEAWFGYEGERGLRNSEWFLREQLSERFADAEVTLFKKPSDRWEENDVSRAYPEETETLRDRLRAFVGNAVNTSHNF